MKFSTASTGHKGLDTVLDSLRFGDNAVWVADSSEDYALHANAFVKESLAEGKNVIYIRFSSRDKVVDDKYNVKTYEVDPHMGFEDFCLKVRFIVEKEGLFAFYVFDCMSDLLSAWASDFMIANFFHVTSSFLYKLDCVSYFALKRNSHSHKAVALIREQAQIILDLYNVDGDIYIHPLKVENRTSPTMFLPHFMSGAEMLPLTGSADTARLFASIPNRHSTDARGNLDYWDKMFIKALELLDAPQTDIVKEQSRKMLDKIIRLIIGKEDKILELARKYFRLGDMTTFGSRLISSGYIGGKGVGMLLARKILTSDTSADWKNILEPHDSFYVGSDVFYSYIIQNNMWELYINHRKEENYFTKAGVLREKLKKGKFPGFIQEKLKRMLEYYGQSPIIVRSSSLLEDGYGNAFAGKYDSYFCVNQGTPAKRYRQLEQAIRNIYSSTMSDNALIYRKKRNLSDKDEQMSLLIQRVSGDHHGKYFFPTLAGVGFSANTYAWNAAMDPSAGFLRLVFGLGTRAVDRAEGDYPRIMALDHPTMQALHGSDDIREYSQHTVDVLDVTTNELATIPLNRLMWEKTGVDMSLFGVYDDQTNEKIKKYDIQQQEAWILTYDKLISETPFVKTMRDMLKTLEKAYNYPVDIEFTVNFTRNRTLQINLLQCRPLQTAGIGCAVEIPENISEENIFFRSSGNFMGGSVRQRVDRIIYISPAEYIALSESDKYEIARTIAKLTRGIIKSGDKHDTPILLMGPGRWGTTTVSMGVPVSFAEINQVTVLCEQSFSAGGMSPELSYGSHFFQDLVEENIFYAAIFADKEGVIFNKDFLAQRENLLDKIVPDAERFCDVIKVIATEGAQITSDIRTNIVICYLAQ